MNVAKIDEKVKKLPSKDQLSVYIKKQGNIEKCLKQPGTASVIKIEGKEVKLNDEQTITEAHNNGVITGAIYTKYK